MFAGIKDILIISTAEAIPRFRDLLGDGSWLGIKISYARQNEPRGIAESFIIGKDFIGKGKVALILGDNIFYGHNLTGILKDVSLLLEGALVFGYYVKTPQRYGVLEFGSKGKVISITEKPQKPKSNWVVTGLYFYDNEVVKIAEGLKPSKRGELEITDINNVYLRKKILKVKLFTRGYAWMDTGTADSLIDASLFIRTIEERQGLKIGCIEEVAYRMGFIRRKQLEELSKNINVAYGEYLRGLLKDEK